MPPSREEFANYQLERIIKDWQPGQRIEIIGAILDYIERTNKSLYDVLKLNHSLFEDIFIRGDLDEQYNLLRSVIRTKAEYDNLNTLCNDSFPIINKRLEALKAFCSTTIVEQPVETVYSPLMTPRAPGDAVIIWQLSDIHFGRFNVIEKM